jgi:serine/threonine protein kinase
VVDPLIGRTLDGRYEVLGRLGEGGVGVVYRGRQVQLNRFVAIKVLHPHVAASPEWRRRFEREATALSALAHPNVVPVTDSGIDRGVPYLVMELLQGKTLSELIKEVPGPLPLSRALDIAREMLRGVAFAHGKGIVHRDLKPANVFLQALPDQTDHVRLLDFGMAKFLDGSATRSDDTVTRVGAVFGTAAYMAPEQVKAAAVDARTDVYAAGVVLFELLAGRRPFVADSREGYMGAHLTEPVPALAKVRPKPPAVASFQPVIERAMAKKPSGRFKDAAAMLAALEAVIAKLPAAALRSGRAEPRAKPKSAPRSAAPSRSGFWGGAIVLVTLAAGIAVVATVLRRDGAKSVHTAARPPKPQALPLPLPPAPSPPKATPPAEPPPPPATPPAEPPTPPALPAPAAAASPAAPTKPEPAPSPPPETEAAVERKELPEPPPTEAQPRSDARNPWQQPVPRDLRPIRDRLARGVHLSQRALQPAYAFAHQNPDDPRPWLLLGHAYAELDWFSDSVERYVRAHRVDSTSRGDPQMLPDLLKAAAHPVAGRPAARAIRDIYGAEAIPALEKAIERHAGDREISARLARLRESLPR